MFPCMKSALCAALPSAIELGERAHISQSIPRNRGRCTHGVEMIYPFVTAQVSFDPAENPTHGSSKQTSTMGASGRDDGEGEGENREGARSTDVSPCDVSTGQRSIYRQV